MTKTLFGAALLATAGAAVAQSSFTIVRPYDGARVREKVKILVPKSSVPSGGYIGVFLNGSLLDAVSPELDSSKSYYQYVLDTKGRGIKDGAQKLELKLYVNYNDQPRIVDTSSVDLTVANRTGIRVPAGGIQLRYRWTPGTEREYTLVQRVFESTGSNVVASTRAATEVQEGEGIRLLYAVDNAYGNGDGLLRLQVIPNRGYLNKEYAFLTTAGSTGPQRFYPENMAPIYMRLTSTGREVFGSVPYFPGNEDGSVRGQGSTAPLSLFASFPLPVLPTKAIRPGSTWEVPLQQGAIDLAKLYTQNSVVEKFKARGEFVGVEWEMGHPVAKIKNSVALGTGAIKPKTSTAASGETLSDVKIGVEETIYFALDTRQVIKIVREQTTEVKVSQGGGFAGAGGMGSPMGGGPSGVPTGGKRRPGGVGPGDRRYGAFQRGGKGGLGDPGDVGGPPSGFGPGGRGPGGGQRGGFNPGGFGGGQNQSTFVRTKLQQVFTLVR